MLGDHAVCAAPDEKAIMLSCVLFPDMKLDPEARRAFFSTAFLALALTAFIFGLLVWGYSVVIQVTHPDWMATPLTHIGVFPLNLRVDLMGIAGFFVSVLSFFFWRLMAGLIKQEGEQSRKRL
jgi:hypothetical protein